MCSWRVQSLAILCTFLRHWVTTTGTSLLKKSCTFFSTFEMGSEEAEALPLTYEHLELLMRLLDSYTDRTVPDEKFLDKSFEDRDVSAGDQAVVAELFFGALLHERMLNCVADRFHQHYNRKNKDDTTMLKVMSLVSLVHLRPGSEHIAALALWGLHGLKAWRLLRLLTNEEQLALLAEDACRLYPPHTASQLLAHLADPGTPGPKLCSLLHQKLNEKARARRRPPTQPLQLGVCRRRIQRPRTPPPTPQEMKQITASPIPLSTWKQPREPRLLADRRAANREAAQQLLEQAQAGAFRCAATGATKSERYWRKLQQLQEERLKQLQPPQPSRRPPPTDKPASFPVKMNAATILREGARFLRDEEQQIQRLRNVAAGLSDPAEVERLLAEEARWLLEQQLADIERKHLQGLLTREEAALARQAVLQRNREARQQCLQESEELSAMLEQMREEELLHAQQMAEKGRAVQVAAREAQQQLLSRKHAVVQEMNEETRAMLEKALKEREEELRQREALIREVRALQQVRAACARAEAEERRRDDATTAGLGLLCEMSIAELRERLQLLREELEEELQLRQRRIREQREDHDALLQTTQHFVQLRRSEMRSLPKPQKQEVKVPNTEELDTLRKKLAEKRELRKKMEAAEKLCCSISSSLYSVEEQSCSQIEEQSGSQIQLKVNSSHA